MLLAPELLVYQKEIAASIDELLVACKANQKHPNDLLLVFNHARRDKEHGLGLMAGYDHLVHAELEQSRIINRLRKDIVVPDEGYVEKLKEQPALKDIDYIILHLEMFMYLKIWESDMHQRTLYHLSSLANGETYDWEFAVDDRTRAMYRLIQERLQSVAPSLATLIGDIYRPAIRNVIAHSQFYITENVITVLNKKGIPDEPLTLTEWRRIASKTLLLHNALQVLGDRVLDEYREQSKATGGILEVDVTKEGVTTEKARLSPMKDRKYWVWTENLSASDLSPKA